MASASGRLAAAMAAIALAVAPVVASGPAAASGAFPTSGGRYVALGDSFTSSPLTGMPVGLPVGCYRTQNNYPRQVASALRVAEFVDRSCGGATTDNLFDSQSVIGGSNNPQLEAVTVDTTLVSLSFGGNDIGLAGLMQRCYKMTNRGLDQPVESCVESWSPGENDWLVQRIDQVAVRLDAALTIIKQRAPLAQVLVVGYPVVAPHAGIGCFPQVPFADGDVAYLRDIQQRLNSVLAWAAEAHGARYVDTYTPSIGHGPCEMVGVKWIEGFVPDNAAAALHPNALGQSAIAGEVLAALGH
ncbi:MAG: SGNH/GDSL hydrolase family protein [Sporichthyaceae bacterium]